MQLKPKMITLAGAICACATMIAPDASACSVPGLSTFQSGAVMPQGLGPLASLLAPMPKAGPKLPGQAAPSIVGLWYVEVYSQGLLVDAAFDAWHSDGTEVLNDYTNPIEDNVCLGVWTNDGGKIHLKHPSWYFDTTGTLQGIALILESITLDPSGDSFTGTSLVKVYDTQGNFLYSYDGALKGTRITAD